MSNKKAFLMSRPSTTLLAIVLATGLAGCMADDPDANSFVAQSVNDRYPLGAAKGPVTMNVDASSGKLSQRQANAVAKLARQASAAGVTPVTVAASNGSKAVANQVIAVLRQNGVQADMIRMAHNSGGSVQVSFVQTLGASRECGVWDKDLTDTAANEPYANHGCAVRANIAAMVADPEDLLVPNGVTPAPSNQGAAAIDIYGNAGVGKDKNPRNTTF